MNRFRNFLPLAVAVALGLATTARAGVVPPDVLRVGLSTRPQPFDPATAVAVEQTAPIIPAYEELTTHSGGPALAQSWRSSPDGLVWTFKLASGHRFDDGRAVNAQAVKFSLDRLAALGRGPASDVLAIIARVDVVDPQTIRITLRHATPRLVYILSERGTAIINPSVASHAVNGDWGSSWLGANSAGSGAYRLRGGGDGGTYVLERNPYWNGPKPHFSQVIYKVIPDPTVRALAIRLDDIDIAVLMPAETLQRLSADPNLRVVARPALAFQALAFNMRASVFHDPRLRWAVAEAIDTEAIIRYLRGGRAARVRGPLPDGMPGADPGLYAVRYDKNAAAQLAARASNFGPRPILMVYPGVSPVTDTIAEYVQASLLPLGLKVRLERLSVAAYVDRLGRGAYDMALVGVVANSDDPTAILAGWFSPANIGSENAARYSNPAVTRLINAAQREMDPARRAAMDHQIIALADRDMPYVYLQQTEVANVVRRDIDGYQLDPVHALDLPLFAMSRRRP
jgi:peptide/nickel transport system substrate-binding protein